ncbi:MAG TPA: hypothetical protein DEZ08_05935 [Dehalococcoidia bacterium]|jgi:uncharacterized protein (UPF0264 family)/dihydrodipicolinate synthase/N-acetylneuraminate lyase|nr:hypothetical protein [Dehalococcoidia bacterium]|tara:strand:- start:1234 stop:3330 length:2097 start_codon:yes stop_codon:yes gene_type:complete
MATYTKSEAQDWAWDTLKGQWTTFITPFSPDDNIDELAIRQNIQRARSLGTTGGGCTWGMGEFWSLSFQERMQVMDVVASEASGKWPIAAHVTHTSYKDMLALADHAENIGFDLLVVAPPYMATNTEEQVYEFVNGLASHSNLAIMFYNSPQFGIVMSPEGLDRLCDIPSVVGVKEASFNQQISIKTHITTGKKSIISTPDEWIFAKGQELGFQQHVMFANTSDWRFDLPGKNNYVQFIDRATRGDLDQAFYDTHLSDIKAISDKWWGYTVQKFGGSLPVAMVKQWGELMGVKSGHVRKPLYDLNQTEKNELKEDLQSVGLIQNEKQPTSIGTRDSSAWLNNADAGSSGMMLLVSAQNMDEVLEADKGGADIIDVKNLQEALVGSAHPVLVAEARKQIGAKKHVSVTLGVVPNQAGTVAMAVHAAAVMDTTSVKVGFINTEYDEAVFILRECRRALHGYGTKLIGSLFADNVLYEKGLDPLLMVKLALDGECDGFLIDTLVKDGRNLFDFIPEPKLKEMVLEGKQAGLSTALSGHLKLDNLDELARINPDIVGVRGAVCSVGDRDKMVAWEAVAHFKSELDIRKTGQVDVFSGISNGNGNGNGNGHRTEILANAVASDSGWTIIDGRGKNCAGVIAALARQIESDHLSFVEVILADALNIYDVMGWAEQFHHKLITKRTDEAGCTRILLQPNVLNSVN